MTRAHSGKTNRMIRNAFTRSWEGRESEIKSVSGVVPQDGGYAVPREIDAMIANAIKEISPIRNLAQVVQVGTSGYRKLVTTGGTA